MLKTCVANLVLERSKTIGNRCSPGEIVGGKKEMTEMPSHAGHVRYITGASLGKMVGGRFAMPPLPSDNRFSTNPSPLHWGHSPEPPQSSHVLVPIVSWDMGDVVNICQVCLVKEHKRTGDHPWILRGGIPAIPDQTRFEALKIQWEMWTRTRNWYNQLIPRQKYHMRRAGGQNTEDLLHTLPTLKDDGG
ncbi:hypothetical protein Tco_1375211 [Tanacetum coccineum]